MVPLLAALVYRIRPQVSEVAGVLVATAGLGLMTLEGSIGSIGRGDLLTLFCAVAFAAHIVTLGHFSEQVSFELLSVAQVAPRRCGFVTVLVGGNAPPGVASGGGLRDTGYRLVGHGSGVYGPGVGSAVHHLDQNGSDLHAGAGFAWMTSYFWMGEGLSGRAAAGAALILGGVLLVELKPLNPRRHPSVIVVRGPGL